MSRIGKKAVQIPAGVDANLNDRVLTITVKIIPHGDSKRARSMWGMQRTLVDNLVLGVTEGFTKTLELNGVGYRAQMKGRNVNLQLGFSHDILYQVADGVEVKCPNQTTIIVSGIDKQKVGQVAAEIRSYRKPEPYKGKGVKYEGEYVFRKEGKKK
jgi:large subunit ribosomal protein L6